MSGVLARAANSAVRRVSPKTTALFVVDIQERFRSNIVAFDAVVGVAQRMTTAAHLLEMPFVLFGEQYPKGLGHIVPELVPLSTATPTTKVLEKTSFSLWNDSARALMPSDSAIDSVILCGIEAHVCVLQTALDLSAEGYAVHVLADGTSSMSNTDRYFAFERLKTLPNVYLTTSQSVIMQLIADAKHPKFKDISNIIKTSLPDPKLSWIQQ